VIDRTLSAKQGPEEIEEVDLDDQRLNLDKVNATRTGPGGVAGQRGPEAGHPGARIGHPHRDIRRAPSACASASTACFTNALAAGRQAFSAIISRIQDLSKFGHRRTPPARRTGSSIKVQNRVIDLRVSICPCVFGRETRHALLDKGAVELDINKSASIREQRDDIVEAANKPAWPVLMTGPDRLG